MVTVIDQISKVPESLGSNLVDIPNMKAVPYHALFQFYAANGRLSCAIYQRGADIFLVVPSRSRAACGSASTSTVTAIERYAASMVGENMQM